MCCNDCVRKVTQKNLFTQFFASLFQKYYSKKCANDAFESEKFRATERKRCEFSILKGIKIAFFR